MVSELESILYGILACGVSSSALLEVDIPTRSADIRRKPNLIVIVSIGRVVLIRRQPPLELTCESNLKTTSGGRDGRNVAGKLTTRSEDLTPDVLDRSGYCVKAPPPALSKSECRLGDISL